MGDCFQMYVLHGVNSGKACMLLLLKLAVHIRAITSTHYNHVHSP